MTTIKRVNYAIDCLIKGRTNTRGFDNCFEGKDGGEVVRRIVKRCLKPQETKQKAWVDFHKEGKPLTIGSKQWRDICSYQKTIDLTKALSRFDTNHAWLYYVANGCSYEGLEENKDKFTKANNWQMIIRSLENQPKGD